MASNKNPSIYYDRGTIGSSEELDEYGVWVKSEPQDLSSVNTDTRETAKPEEDFSPELAGDLPDIKEFDADPQLPESQADMMELADFNLSSADGALFNDDFAFMSGDTETEYVEMEPLKLDAETEEQMPDNESADAAAEDDLSGISIDDFLLEPESEPVPPPPSPEISAKETGKAEDLSTRLLMKIAEELSSIKDELSSLKKELYQSKHPAATPAEQNNGGFFDEEEDEKIALTGDELNTILNTTDFTAEAGAPDQEEAIEPGSLTLSGEDTESPDETGGAPDFPEQLLESDEAFFSGINAAMEDLPEIEESFIFSAKDMEIPPELEIPSEMEISPELEILREKGVEPMMPALAPEDIDLLEDDQAITDLAFLDLSEDDSLNPPDTPSFDSSSFDDNSSFDNVSFDDTPSFDGSSFNFEDAVIEEPDLKGELKENPIEEPSLENLSLELDMEEPSAEDEALELLDSEGDSNDADNNNAGLEEIEIHPDSDGSNELVSNELSEMFSPDEGLLDTADLSIDDLIDLSFDEETREIIGDTPDDAYDQVIPEGFLIESGDIPALEQNILNDEFPETIDDSFADPLALEDILEKEALPIEDFSEDGSAELEPVLEELETLPEELEPVLEELETFPEELEPIREELETLPEKTEAEEAPSGEEDDIASVADFQAEILEEEDTPGISLPAKASPTEPAPRETHPAVDVSAIPSGIKLELRNVLSYMDQLLESLPENKIEEFAKSEYFDTYKKLFEDLGLA